MAQTSPETDREALVALYNATGGPNWNSNHNWLSDVPISGWSGVNADDNGRVNYLLRRDNQLSGEIPPELGNLGNLTRLGLTLNQLSGKIPPELGNLGDLTSLILSYNQLSGKIPPELGNLASLTSLILPGTVERGDTARLGQPLQPDSAGPRQQPVERVRAKQLVGSVEYGFFGPRWSPVLPMRPRLTRARNWIAENRRGSDFW